MFLFTIITDTIAITGISSDTSRELDTFWLICHLDWYSNIYRMVTNGFTSTDTFISEWETCSLNIQNTVSGWYIILKDISHSTTDIITRVTNSMIIIITMTIITKLPV
jgi:hypothetical protein